MSGFELTLEPERSPRRFEVITGAGGRRRWSADDKARVLEETLVPGAVVSEVARRARPHASSCSGGAGRRDER